MKLLSRSEPEKLTFASAHCEDRFSHNIQQQSTAEASNSSIPECKYKGPNSVIRIFL